MEYISVSRSVKIAPRKIGLIASSVREKSSLDAVLNSLSLIKKRGATDILKTLKSGVANALNKGAKREELVIKSIEVTQGPSLKRYRPSTRGRVHPYKKRSSNIRIVLEEKGGSKLI